MPTTNQNKYQENKSICHPHTDKGNTLHKSNENKTPW